MEVRRESEVWAIVNRKRRISRINEGTSKEK